MGLGLPSGEIKCPVCDVGLFAGRGTYEICDECGWENDPQQADDPTLKGGANQLSLTEAREAYEERAVTKDDDDDDIEKETDEDFDEDSEDDGGWVSG